MAEFATGAGADGVLVQVPFRIIRDEAAVLDFYRTICETELSMLMIQDLEWGAPGLPVDTIVRLFDEIDAFRCIKVETVPAGSKYTAVLDATQGRLNVSGGWAIPQLIEALDRGVHAIMPGGLHWPLVEIMRRYAAGDRDSARELFHACSTILGWRTQHIDISNQFLKLLAVRQGIYRTAACETPWSRTTPTHTRIAEELIEDAVILHEELGWARSYSRERGFDRLARKRGAAARGHRSIASPIAEDGSVNATVLQSMLGRLLPRPSTASSSSGLGRMMPALPEERRSTSPASRSMRSMAPSPSIWASVISAWSEPSAASSGSARWGRTRSW